MADQLIYSDVLVDNSITNPHVESNNALDNNSPFSFLDYLKHTNSVYTPAEYNKFYTDYLKRWSSVKNDTVPTNAFIAEQYTELLKDISLNYTTLAERKFLSQIDFTNPLDLDIAMPFYTKKIKEIILFYKQKRDTGTFVIERNKIKGTNTSLERCIYELITQYIFSDDNIEGSSGLNYDIEKIKRNLNINVDEFIDIYSNYFDLPRDPVDESVIREELYTFNTNSIESDIFFNKTDEVTKMVFGSEVFLSQIPLAVNVALNYNPICSPVNPLSTLVEDDSKDQIGADGRIELKKKLFRKYLGSDFYYLSTNSMMDSSSGVFIQAYNPSGNLLNMQTADIAGVEAGQLKALRDIGLFFKPDKQGILKVSAKSYQYTINRDLLEPDRIYIFPDPSVYGNVSLNAQLEYPLIYTFDILPELRNRSSGITYGDPNIGSDEQSIVPYYSRQQNRSKFQTTEIFTDLSDLYNQGLIQKWQTDIYGNQYAIFKDQYGQYFTANEDNSNKDVIKCLHLDGHVFFDEYEGYNFDYTIHREEDDGITVRSGIATHTVEYESSPSFILSSDPLYLNFRKFYPYQSCGTFSELGNVDVIKYATLYSCGTLMNVDDQHLPDPISAGLSAFPGSGYYYYDNLYTAAVGGLNPVHRALTDVPSLSANLFYSLRYQLSSGNARAFSCGTLGDTILIDQNPDNTLFINSVDQDAQTVMSTLSSTGNVPHPISFYKALTGVAFIRSIGSTASTPLSSTLSATIAKYNAYVRNQITNHLIDFEVIYDTIVLKSKNVIVFDKIAFTESGYTTPSTRNTYYQLDPTDTFNKITNCFFNETSNTVTFAIMNQFSELSGSVSKIIYPNIYRYNVSDNKATKLWPVNTYSDVKAVSGHYVTSGFDTMSANIVTIGEPKLTYNSKNDLWKLTMIGKDLNNFPYVYDYTLRERSSIFETISSKCYTMTGKTAQTSLWVTPSAQYVSFGIFDLMTLTNQGIQ